MFAVVDSLKRRSGRRQAVDVQLLAEVLQQGRRQRGGSFRPLACADQTRTRRGGVHEDLAQFDKAERSDRLEVSCLHWKLSESPFGRRTVTQVPKLNDPGKVEER